MTDGEMQLGEDETWDVLVQRLRGDAVTHQFLNRKLDQPDRAVRALDELAELGFVTATDDGWTAPSDSLFL